MPTLTSGNITLIDLTDVKKIDVHIASNHPIVQIANNGVYTPDWSQNNLKLTATVYADSTPVTELSTFQWKKITGVYPNEIEEPLDGFTSNVLTISNNELSKTSMVRYKCIATYSNNSPSNEITFTRIDNGVSAPAVQARYSVDGNKANMEVALESTRHKYIHFSYDGGLNWTEGVRITGEQGKDGQSISLKGTAYTTDELVVGGVVTLYSDATTQNDSTLIQGDKSGDSYLVDGYLCVYNGTNFICTGQIQGPKGEDGDTYYLYIRYANSTGGSDFSDVPGDRKYIGFYRTTAASLPTNIDKSSATWNWAKFAGEDAKTITLTGSAQAFKVNKNNTVSPETIEVRAQLENTTISSNGWSYSVDGGKSFSVTVPTGVSRSGNIVTIDGNKMNLNSIAIKATSTDGRSDVFTVYRVSDGVDGDIGPEGVPATTVFLTNEHIPFTANSNGQVKETTVTCNVVEYSGINKVTPTIGAIAGLPDGMSITPNCGTAYTNSELAPGNIVDLFFDKSYGIPIDTSKLNHGDTFVAETYLCKYDKTANNFICEDIIITDNELMLTIKVAENSTLGSESSISKRFAIPIVDETETTLWLNWSKINSGQKGEDAPAVKAQYSQYSANGTSDWTTSLDTSKHKYVRLSYDDGITWSAAMKIVGDDAKNITLTANAQVFKVDKSYVVTPTTITVTAQAINTSIPTNGWVYSTDGGKTFTSTVPAGVVRNGNTITITGATLVANSVVIKVSDGTYSDTLTIYKALDGIDAPIAFLTNENITFSANAQGQIASTTIISNVVAYNGTNKVTPTIGTITGTPTGMTITPSIVEASNEMKLTIVIANNSTLGSASSNMGVISIPITSPVNTTLYLTWSKVNTGITGAGIKSTTVSYGVSDSTSTRPADSEWKSTMPTATDGQYLWTRTIIDYTDDALPDTVTYTYTKQGVQGSSGTSVTVKSIEYQSGTSATTAPTGTWSSSVVSVAENNYLWTKTTFSDNKVAYGVAKQGSKGETGRGVSSIVEQYYQSTSATAQSGGSWSTTVPTWEDGKYIWTRSVITYTDSTSSTTSPICISGQKGATGGTGASGVGVSSVDVWYYQSSSATSLSGGSWVTTAPTWVDGKYIWTKTITTYTDTTSDETGAVCITGQKGATGAQGIQGIQGPKGEQGIQGPQGLDGKTSYFHIKYSANANGNPMTETPSTYIGTYVDYTEADSTDYTKYTWSRFVGAQGAKGDQGIAGTNGVDGQTSYLHIAYATSSNGSSGFSVSDSVGKTYIGQYTDHTQADSTDYTKYKWTLIKGDKGSDAYTVILTNESHIFAGNVSSAIASSTTTQVVAYKGSTTQSVTIVSVDGKTASTSSTATSIAGLSFSCSALSSTSPTITFTCTTSFVSPSGTIPIVITVDGVTITKMFTYSIAFKGATGSQGSTGTAASLVDITPSALYFKSTTGKDGTFTPDYIYLYPRFQTVTYSKWEYSVDGGTTWIAASGANGLSISTYNSVANTLRVAKTSTLYTNTVTSISFRCVSSNTSVYDTVSVAKIYDVVDLQIGGRNLLTNSGYMTNLNGWSVYSSTYPVNDLKLEANDIYGSVLTATGTATNSRIRVGQYIPYLQKANRTLTFSMVYQASVDSTLVTAGGKYSESDNSGEYSSFAGTNIKRTDLGNGFTYMETTFNLTYTEATRSFFVYIYPGVQTTKIVYCKLEEGNKTTAGWSSAPEDLKTFQLYAPKGYLITKDVPEVTLQTFAYEGSIAITNATFKWYSRSGDSWIVISGATSDSLVVNKSDVLKSNVYKCEMTYRGIKYEATATVEDKTDIYESVMCISSNARGNNCYWVLYTLVYTDAEEIDPLLGPISISAPASPASGDYWYAIDETNASVQLKKYNGTSWANSTDIQSLSYYWDIINNGSEKVPFGDHSKVQVVSCNDFTATATLICGVNNVEDGLLTQSSLSLTDASDPIVSTIEPSSVIDGQIWIKPNNNGTYIMSVWDATNDMWVVNDMDTRTKVHTSKPSTYSVGDLWITASDTEHSGYLEGTLLMANTSSSTFSESHWSTTLKYDKDLDSIKETLNDLSQYVNITSEGLKISAQSASGEISPFTSLFTSTELAFYQNSDKLLTLANNQLTAPHIVVEDDLEVGKSISLGNLSLTIETNGSFSFAVQK